MIFPGDVGLFRWASEGLFGFVKRRRERQQPLYRQASRFIEAFEAHGVARQQVPRLMPEPIRLTLQAVATPEALAAKLQLEHLDWAGETLADRVPRSGVTREPWEGLVHAGCLGQR